LGRKTGLTVYGKVAALNMPHQKLIRVLNYIWLLVVFPVAVAILVGVLGHSTSLGFKTFLLIECGMAVLSPLLSAVINDGNHTQHHRRK
jgi:predicted Co/Zn/Cd cation transporter (cation efflux family)